MIDAILNDVQRKFFATYMSSSYNMYVCTMLPNRKISSSAICLSPWPNFHDENQGNVNERGIKKYITRFYQNIPRVKKKYKKIIIIRLHHYSRIIAKCIFYSFEINIIYFYIKKYRYRNKYRLGRGCIYFVADFIFLNRVVEELKSF